MCVLCVFVVVVVVVVFCCFFVFFVFEYCNTLRGKLNILGDFNIHFDSPSNPLTSKALQIITTFDIVQGVRDPSHRCGHIIN